MQNNKFQPCQRIEIKTPGHVVLSGLWFGPIHPKRVIVFIHGLTGSAFSMRRLVKAMIGADTAVITFNSRGSAHIADVKRVHRGKSEYIRAGTAHEVFTDSADDIQGVVNFAKEARIKNVYLAGHSTGCQKAYYWASKNKGEKAVKGIILLGPLSDYSGALKTLGKKKLEKAVAHARALVKAGKPHDFMPAQFREWFVCDAQRFLSLYTPDSVEEIFPYAHDKNPRLMNSVRVPTFVVLAGADEHGDIPPRKIAQWFMNRMQMSHKVEIVPRVGHSFKGAEKMVLRAIRSFMKES